MSIIPTIHTPRLILRPPDLDDAPSLQKNFDDYEVIRYLSSAVPWPYPADGALCFLRDTVIPNQGKDRWTWGLFLHENPSMLIGVIDLWRKGRPEHRGFWLARQFWRQGLMTEAAAAITDYAFEQLGFEELIFSNAVGNTASRRVKEKTGAIYIEKRPAQFVDPQFTEHELWKIDKATWQKNN